MAREAVISVCSREGHAIPVTVVRKRVRNLNLRVKADGTVVLSMPARCSLERAREFLVRKADWIADHVARQQTLSAATQEAARGKTGMFPLWGSFVRTAEALGLDADELARLDSTELERRIEMFYKKELQARLPEFAARYENTLGVKAARWSLRTMKTRWGSCTPKTGAIRINTRLAAYPPACLDFVVAHELTHLLESSHNARFHVLLDQACPGNREAAARLKQPAVSE